MPSSSKTSYLKLNHWSAGDKPKMADFNSDNQLVDSALQEHAQNTALHLAGNQSAWIQQPFASGTYTGNGSATKSVVLGFRPELVVILPQAYGPLELDTTQQMPVIRFAIGADGYGSSGLTITINGFTVAQDQDLPLTGLSMVSLNQNNVTYRYFAIRPV